MMGDIFGDRDDDESGVAGVLTLIISVGVFDNDDDDNDDERGMSISVGFFNGIKGLGLVLDSLTSDLAS